MRGFTRNSECVSQSGEECGAVYTVGRFLLHGTGVLECFDAQWELLKGSRRTTEGSVRERGRRETEIEAMMTL